jgi:hypothetical protein
LEVVGFFVVACRRNRNTQPEGVDDAWRNADGWLVIVVLHFFVPRLVETMIEIEFSNEEEY